jgi:chemotaxis protein methyltransferase CheR
VRTQLIDRFREIIYAESGIALSPRKEALLSARLGKRMRALGIASYDEYLRFLETEQGVDEIVPLLDAVSTNVTSFYREASHFDIVRDVVASWVAHGQKRLRFWSAACSTGEEPYSLAMTLADEFDTGALDMRILATDISTQALAQAEGGRYEPRKIAGIPEDQIARHMVRSINDGEITYTVTPDIRRMVHFTRLNLSQPPFPMRGPLDMVFCRNVMIYFDNDVRLRLLTEIERLLRPGGYLFVGHAESLAGMMSGLKYVAPSVYVKP